MSKNRLLTSYFPDFINVLCLWVNVLEMPTKKNNQNRAELKVDFM